MIKRPNLRIHEVKGDAEVQNKCTGNLFNINIANNFLNLDMHTNTIDA